MSKGDIVSGPYIYSRPRPSKGTVTLIALASLGTGMLADRVIHTIGSSPFDNSSIEATNVRITESSGNPIEGDLTVHVHTLGKVSLQAMRQEVQDRITEGTLAGYHDPTGVYAYRPDCFDTSGQPPNTQTTTADLSCSFILWNKSGPPPADN